MTEHTTLNAVKCSECGQLGDITSHGTCWRCHIQDVRFNTSIEARKKRK